MGSSDDSGDDPPTDGGTPTPGTDEPGATETPTGEDREPDETAEPPGESSYAVTIERVGQDELHDRFGIGSLDGAPATVEDAARVSESDVFGDDVVDFEALPADAQSEIEQAMAQGQASFDESPAILDAGNPDYIRIDGDLYRIAVSVAN